MTYRDLLSKLQDQPFQPFRIKLVNGTTYEIQEPWHVVVGETRAIIITKVRKDDKGYEFNDEWRTVSIAHMIEFIDLPAKKSESKRAKAPNPP